MDAGALPIGFLRGTYQKLRKVQLELVLFNASNIHLVFGMKVAFIGTSILTGFAAIQLFHDDRLLSVVSAVILVNNLFVFNLVYDKGFSIPRRVTRLRSLLVEKLKLAHVVTQEERGVLTRQVKSIGIVAVRVGHFHHLERTSTPKFLDFCIKNIMRIVLAYRKNN